LCGGQQLMATGGSPSPRPTYMGAPTRGCRPLATEI
jgi:hypothetical protein